MEKHNDGNRIRMQLESLFSASSNDTEKKGCHLDECATCPKKCDTNPELVKRVANAVRMELARAFQSVMMTFSPSTSQEMTNIFNGAVNGIMQFTGSTIHFTAKFADNDPQKVIDMFAEELVSRSKEILKKEKEDKERGEE